MEIIMPIEKHLATSIWKTEEFNSAELTQLNGYLSQPIVKRYLFHMVAMTFQALATGGPNYANGQTNASYLFDQARVQGGLDVLDKLMKFQYSLKAGDSFDDTSDNSNQ